MPPINHCKLKCPRKAALEAATWQETAGYSPARMFIARLRLGALGLTQAARANFICPERHELTDWEPSDFCKQSTVNIVRTGRVSWSYLTDHEQAVLEPYRKDMPY